MTEKMCQTGTNINYLHCPVNPTKKPVGYSFHLTVLLCIKVLCATLVEPAWGQAEKSPQSLVFADFLKKDIFCNDVDHCCLPPHPKTVGLEPTLVCKLAKPARGEEST